jgi:23S rRNA pseudouridine1911/1915/1917 synthase
LAALKIQASETDRGKRLDSLLHERLPQFSRSRLQSWIREGRALVDGQTAKSSHLLRGAEIVLVDPGELPPIRATPEDIPVAVLYEDESAIVIDKPAGMVVHAGAGVHEGTLVNALLHRFQTLSTLGGELRPGIVHRLDRFTSGVLLVAKNDAAHRDLAAQFASRQVQKTYLTLVEGQLEGKGRIDQPITRDPRNRARMTARLAFGRPSLTSWESVELFADFTFLKVDLGTGRTHQIRAHMAAINRPVAGDRMYGAEPSPWNRYFLHAHRLVFRSPATGAEVTVESPLPPDLVEWKASLA